jgi:hypothetical protein
MGMTLRKWYGRRGGRFTLTVASLCLFVWVCNDLTLGALELKNRDTGRILLISPVKPGDEFSLWFINSQDRFPMAEVFQIKPNYSIHLARIETEYDIAGNPWAYPDIRRIDDLRNNPYLFFSGSKELTQHTFSFKGDRIPLWREPHQLMEVTVGKLTMWQYVLRWIWWKAS